MPTVRRKIERCSHQIFIGPCFTLQYTKCLLEDVPDLSVFSSPFSYIWGHQGAKCGFSCMCPTTLSFQLIFCKLAPNVYWTMFQISVYFHHHLVTFVATRGPNMFFRVCALQPLVLKGSFPSLQQIFTGPCSRLQYIFGIH